MVRLWCCSCCCGGGCVAATVLQPAARARHLALRRSRCLLGTSFLHGFGAALSAAVAPTTAAPPPVVPQDGYDLRLAATSDSRWTHPGRLTVASGAGTRRRANEAQASHAHRSRDRLTVATGAGARRRAKEAPRAPGAEPRGRAACRIVMTSGLHTGQGVSGAGAPRRRGVQTRVAARLARVGRGRGSIPRLAVWWGGSGSR